MIIEKATRKKLGLICVEDYPPQVIWEQHLAPNMKPEVATDEWYKTFIDMHFHLAGVPVEDVWAYVRDVHNLAEWTVSMRDIQILSSNSAIRRFKAKDELMPIDEVYGEFKTYPDQRTIDLRVGDRPDNLWFTQTLMVMDSNPRCGLDGTTVLWTFFRHSQYDRTEKAKELWGHLPVIAALSRDNLTKILLFLLSPKEVTR